MAQYEQAVLLCKLDQSWIIMPVTNWQRIWNPWWYTGASKARVVVTTLLYVLVREGLWQVWKSFSDRDLTVDTCQIFICWMYFQQFYFFEFIFNWVHCNVLLDVQHYSWLSLSRYESSSPSTQKLHWKGNPMFNQISALNVKTSNFNHKTFKNLVLRSWLSNLQISGTNTAKL